MSVLVAAREWPPSYDARPAAALTEIAGKIAAASLAWANAVRAPASDVAIRSAWQALLLSFIVNVGVVKKNGERKRVRPTRVSRGASTDDALSVKKAVARGGSPRRACRPANGRRGWMPAGTTGTKEP
ncbi:MAG: hypothetical protein LBJ65_17455 [Burkholderia sp.]|uniref:hypothetical protein n=1 Tax=Burkholderia sp. TaxID=36773 RepID=UPI002826E660|nr:hypothetical protein [Burkholderia sp.]MDR0243382.1 hypothetical protein [Burkholderia sp.]